MKKILLLTITLLSVTDYATAQFAAVVEGQVVRQTKPQSSVELLIKAQKILKNIASQYPIRLTFDRMRNINAQAFAELPTSSEHNAIIAAVGLPEGKAPNTYKGYNVLRVGKDIRGLPDFQHKYLIAIDDKFKELVQTNKQIELHRHKGTREEGTLIAVYRNPEEGERNQLNLVQVRIVNKK